MRTSELKRKILHMFNDSDYHGYDISKLLAEESEDVELSRLYRVLNDMENEGLLKSHWEKSARGPRKKVYSIDKKGEQERENMLLEAIETVHAHYDRYIMGLPPENSVFNIIVKKMLKNTKKKCNIGFITPSFSSIHHRLISTINKTSPDAAVYLISPNQIDLDPKLKNIIQLDGFYNDIPLKEKFLDILTVLGVPPVNLINKSINEWSRSITDGGKLVILTPTILIEQFDHPMAIGQFMENIEHKSARRHEFPSKDDLEEKLRSNFDSVEQEKIIHITTYFAENR